MCAERDNRTQTTLMSEKEQFFEFIFSGKYDVHYFSFLGNNMVMVQWKYQKGCVVPPSNNLFIAVFTMAYAHLKMYGYLEKLGKRILHTDTDSYTLLKMEKFPWKVEIY